MVLVHHPHLAEPFHAVYKATIGERPLADFPVGTLARREVAAFLVSEATGWGIVPPTVLRDGPFGEGMVQAWIHPDPEADIVAMVMHPDPRLRRMAVFDAIINNTDRKGGHVLPVPDGHAHGVDHGVTFSTVPKLRTVLWGWMGTPMNEDEIAGVERVREGLDGNLGTELRALLSRSEVAATRRRVMALLKRGRFPRPGRNWPAVPWPTF
ncbi:MAG: SCO1664 family protein [Chloroflexota bacterium]